MRANHLIEIESESSNTIVILVEFLLKFTSNSSFQ